MNRRTQKRNSNLLYYLILLLALTVLLVILFIYVNPVEIMNKRRPIQVATVETSQQPTTAAEPVFSAPSPAVITSATIKRGGRGKNEYVIAGEGIDVYNLRSFIVVYAKDPAGFEYDAAVMYVIGRNKDNITAKTIFQNPDAILDSMAALRVDNNLNDVNLTRMTSVDEAFVGFTIDKGHIRINPNEPLHVGDELLAVELTANGDALPLSTPLLFRVDSLSVGGEMASVYIVGTTEWPSVWTLLIPKNSSNSYRLMVNDFIASNEICVRKGDQVKVSAEGNIIAGEFVGPVGPEGKEHFQLLGFTTPIDPLYDIIPEFPHAVLMFRIADPSQSATEGWLHYDTTKQFTAEKTGCMEFDINDKDNSDDSGVYSVQIEVNPR